MVGINSTKQNIIQFWQTRRTEEILRNGVFSGGVTSPINTDFLDHRYLETTNADCDFYWCDRHLSQMTIFCGTHLIKIKILSVVIGKAILN